MGSAGGWGVGRAEWVGVVGGAPGPDMGGSEANTVPERLDMLPEHRDTIRRQIRELTLSVAALNIRSAPAVG